MVRDDAPPPNLSRRDPETRRLVRMCRSTKLSGDRQHRDLHLSVKDDDVARLLDGKSREDLIPGRRALRVVRTLANPSLTKEEFARHVWRFRIASQGNPTKLGSFTACALDLARVYACLPPLQTLSPCPELVAVMDGMLWGTMPIPACQKRFELLYESLSRPYGTKTAKLPEETMAVPQVAAPSESQLCLFR